VTASTHSSVMPAPATTASSSAIPASATVGALADPLSTFHGDRKPVRLRHTIQGLSGLGRVPASGSRYGALSPRQERRLNQVDPITAGPHLRLVWPQGQGAGTESVRSLALEFPFDIARPGYSVGTKVLQAVLPEHAGPTAVVPVEMGDLGLEERDGIEAKAVVLQQLRSALPIIREHGPARITTVGGECSVSMAPFSQLINKHGDDLAILWIDSHPDADRRARADHRTVALGAGVWLSEPGNLRQGRPPGGPGRLPGRALVPNGNWRRTQSAQAGTPPWPARLVTYVERRSDTTFEHPERPGCGQEPVDA
jgi:Arginase family